MYSIYSNNAQHPLDNVRWKSPTAPRSATLSRLYESPSRVAITSRHQDSPSRVAITSRLQDSPSQVTVRIRHHESPSGFAITSHRQDSPSRVTIRIGHQKSPSRVGAVRTKVSFSVLDERLVRDDFFTAGAFEAILMIFL